jgi:hypothetical protein
VKVTAGSEPAPAVEARRRHGALHQRVPLAAGRAASRPARCRGSTLTTDMDDTRPGHRANPTKRVCHAILGGQKDVYVPLVHPECERSPQNGSSSELGACVDDAALTARGIRSATAFKLTTAGSPAGDFRSRRPPLRARQSAVRHSGSRNPRSP